MQAKLYRIEIPAQGFLAIMARPELDAGLDAACVYLVGFGVGQVISLLEPSEEHDLGLDGEREAVRAHGMSYLSYPIPDMGVPPSTDGYAGATRQVYRQVIGGLGTVVHCRAGVGRSGLFAAGVLLHSGCSAEDAFARIGEARGVAVPETRAQREWLIANQAAIVGDA